MDQKEHELLLSKTHSLRSDNLVAYFFTFTLLFTTALMYFFSSFFGHFFWLVSTLLFSITLFQWSILQHDFSHNYFFETKSENITWGLFASLFTLIPFHDNKTFHLEHHDHLGSNLDGEKLSLNFDDKTNAILEKLWKFHFPILTPIILYKRYWNIEKLKAVYASKHILTLLSYLLPLLFHLYIFFSLSPLHYLKTWGLAYLFYFYILDIFLISQHSKISEATKEISGQDQFCKDLKVPSFIEKFFLLGYNRHTLHHLAPNLPGYHLCMIPKYTVNEISLVDIIKERNKISLNELNNQNN